MRVPLTDLQAHRRVIGDVIDARVLAVINSGRWVMGPEIESVEADLGAFCGSRNVISCSNGTDALVMGLLALGVRAGDAVVCPAFTFAATAEAISFIGAIPIFADIEEGGFNMCPDSLKASIIAGEEAGLDVVGVIPVDLFGIAARYTEIEHIAATHGMWVLADAAQSFGCETEAGAVGTLATITTTSFFPAKPLGCYGDGGAIFTDDDDLAAVLTSLRVHGKGAHKYDNERVGLNARLDAIQAAVVCEKLSIFADELAARRRVADRYSELLGGVVALPVVPPGMAPAWAQYTIRVQNRDAVQRSLANDGVGTAVYYSLPLHRQTAYQGGAGAQLVDRSRSEIAATEALSIPMHAYMSDDDVELVAGALASATASE